MDPREGGAIPMRRPDSIAGREPERFGAPDASAPASKPCPTAADLSPAGADAAFGPAPGAVSGVVAGGGVFSGEDGLAAIVQDHQVIRTLFFRCDNSRSPPERLAAVRDLVHHVSRHASAEERTLYPLVMDDTVNKQLLHYLGSHAPSGPEQWAVLDATLAKFRAIEEEHLGEEEAKVIDPLRSVLSGAENKKLARDWAAAWANAPTHPHPEGPTAALGARLLHPLVGAVDRMGDALSLGDAPSAGGRAAQASAAEETH
ncbi:hypothetical protein HYH03_012302 [Edaphochlamys debaryana]|uniref:Hemerythrin-like domain-containing protein n=1 Tax=Edaphochlamys debaryana TaxID=47281 RepID=A0A836BUR3_9CHLO|nr:hypothetical protein HYH03_012302 [Edaphochlamys debaryana]|eukprot:KAG2489282.1 hypothetical protein HYH03_012302 [Edaphochlamys debaryana]